MAVRSFSRAFSGWGKATQPTNPATQPTRAPEGCTNTNTTVQWSACSCRFVGVHGTNTVRSERENSRTRNTDAHSAQVLARTRPGSLDEFYDRVALVHTDGKQQRKGEDLGARCMEHEWHYGAQQPTQAACGRHLLLTFRWWVMRRSSGTHGHTLTEGLPRGLVMGSRCDGS